MNEPIAVTEEIVPRAATAIVPPALTREQKDAFLAKAKGTPCKLCKADKPFGAGTLCEECFRIKKQAEAGLETVLCGWPDNDAEFDKLTERIRRYYREDIAKQKARVEEERNG